MRWGNAMKGRFGQCENQQGFTLIELTVAMTLMLLLMTAGIRGLGGYIRYAQFKKQNEYARSIYLAAQAELTKRSQTGQLAGLTMLFADDEPLDPEGLTGTDGRAVDTGQVWAYEQGQIYALEAGGQKQDYARYLAGELDSDDAEDRKVQALYQLIDPYLLDQSALTEGTVRIELDPREGLVYGVFYSSFWPEGFEINAGHGKADIRDRSAEYRKEAMIGYYGVETMSASVSGRPEKPKIRSLKLQNSNMLKVSWQVSAKDVEAWKNLTYDIGIYSSIVWKDEEAYMKAEELQPELVCRILLNPGQFGEGSSLADFSGVPKKLTTLDSGNDYQVIQALVVQNGVTEWRCFPILADQLSCRITLILNDPKYSAGKEEEASASDGDEEYLWFSYSDYSPMDPSDEDQAERISCTVIGYGEGYVCTSMKESPQVTCSFFDPEEDSAEEDLSEED